MHEALWPQQKTLLQGKEQLEVLQGDANTVGSVQHANNVLQQSSRLLKQKQDTVQGLQNQMAPTMKKLVENHIHQLTAPVQQLQQEQKQLKKQVGDGKKWIHNKQQEHKKMLGGLSLQ